MIRATDEEIEQERLEAMEGFDSSFDPTPGSYGCHEALHTASVANHLVCDALVDHPAIVANKEWYRLAHRAHEALYELYQAIGSEHLERLSPQP